MSDSMDSITRQQLDELVADLERSILQRRDEVDEWKALVKQQREAKLSEISRLASQLESLRERSVGASSADNDAGQRIASLQRAKRTAAATLSELQESVFDALRPLEDLPLLSHWPTVHITGGFSAFQVSETAPIELPEYSSVPIHRWAHLKTNTGNLIVPVQALSALKGFTVPRPDIRVLRTHYNAVQRVAVMRGEDAHQKALKAASTAKAIACRTALDAISGEVSRLTATAHGAVGSIAQQTAAEQSSRLAAVSLLSRSAESAVSARVAAVAAEIARLQEETAAAVRQRAAAPPASATSLKAELDTLEKECAEKEAEVVCKEEEINALQVRLVEARHAVAELSKTVAKRAATVAAAEEAAALRSAATAEACLKKPFSESQATESVVPVEPSRVAPALLAQYEALRKRCVELAQAAAASAGKTKEVESQNVSVSELPPRPAVGGSAEVLNSSGLGDASSCRSGTCTPALTPPTSRPSTPHNESVSQLLEAPSAGRLERLRSAIALKTRLVEEIRSSQRPPCAVVAPAIALPVARRNVQAKSGTYHAPKVSLKILRQKLARLQDEHAELQRNVSRHLELQGSLKKEICRLNGDLTLVAPGHMDLNDPSTVALLANCIKQVASSDMDRDVCRAVGPVIADIFGVSRSSMPCLFPD